MMLDTAAPCALGWRRAAPLAALAGLLLGCPQVQLPGSGAALFMSPQSNPLALSQDGTRLYVANTTSGTLSVLDVENPLAPVEIAQIKVGHDPVGVAVRPSGPGEDELVFVTNHISDSISVVSRERMAVTQTLQDLDADGISTTNEPVGVAFAGPSRAFVTLDHSNEVLVLDLDPGSGTFGINPARLPITAQAPRAVAVAGNQLFVASFESFNQTELSTCTWWDERGLLENDAAMTDEGCEIPLELISNVSVSGGLSLGKIGEFAARNPNIGGRVIRDTDLPDRDLFVFDVESLALQQVVEHVGTLLYGLDAGSGGRLYVTNTEARNHLDGLHRLDNRMFENRLSFLDCAPGCGGLQHADLDAGAAGLGQTVPIPHGLDVSGDGETVVVTAAAADGDPGDGRVAMHGLFTLDRNGQVLGSALVGALPEGVALRSDAGGAAQVAFVLNTTDSTISVVDVSDPAQPTPLVAALTIGSDPTPPEIRLGRALFNGARASTSRTFSCASCHPNGNIDQLLWVINTPESPDDGPAPSGEIAEPRSTMPIRGLRDTLPLHWEGVLADPFPGVNPNAAAFDSDGDCPLPDPNTGEGEITCSRHLVNASLRGVMCQQNGAGCVPGPGQAGPGGSGLPGNLTDAERDAMAAFQLAVTFPPPPKRRPDDVLSPLALQGVSDFFTNEDGKGVNSPGGVGQFINFAPATCADNAMGCHALPLTVSTNSNVVGGFDAPSARGMWDRSVLFSNGIVSSEEGLRMAQDCADGIEPPQKLFLLNLGGSQPVPVFLKGDPCNLRSSQLDSLILLAQLPFPSGSTVYDPAVGMTERGSFLATFEGLFALVYGFRGEAIWAFQEEIGTGLPGIAGRQVHVDRSNVLDSAVAAQMDRIEEAAALGKITAVATGEPIGELRFLPETGRWSSANGLVSWTGEKLRRAVLDADGSVMITADLPANVSIGGADRQPLLFENPVAKAAETNGMPPTLPRPAENQATSFVLGERYVEPGAIALVNGVYCASCSVDLVRTLAGPALSFGLNPGLPAGVHVIQVQNPNGWVSNEMPICVTNGVDVCMSVPQASDPTILPIDEPDPTPLPEPEPLPIVIRPPSPCPDGFACIQPIGVPILVDADAP
jgi:YVTN family beta-propeller protein